MVWFARTLLVLLLWVAGCVKNQTLQCGDLICPIGTVCARNAVCVSQELQNACDGRGEGADCNLPEFGDGTCQNGLCIVGMCGDGMINNIEECDGTDFGTASCLDHGSTDPSGLHCTADCQIDATGCKAYCGDGVKDAQEECDGSDFGGATCISKGFYGGTLLCTAPSADMPCAINVGNCSGSCGDGTINGISEQCDMTNLGGLTCATLPAGTLGGPHLGAALRPLTCDTMCQFADFSCTCGDYPDGTCPTGQSCNDVSGTPTCQ